MGSGHHMGLDRGQHLGLLASRFIKSQLLFTLILVNLKTLGSSTKPLDINPILSNPRVEMQVKSK